MLVVTAKVKILTVHLFKQDTAFEKINEEPRPTKEPKSNRCKKGN